MRERSDDESFMGRLVFHRLGLIGKIDIVQDWGRCLSSVMLVRYRIALGIFIMGLVLSGISALPLQWELSILDRRFGSHLQLGHFISHVH